MVTFAEYKALRDKAFVTGRLTEDEQSRVSTYVEATRRCPSCGSDTADEDAFDQGVQECRRCGKKFCWHCGGEEDLCAACVEHEDSGSEEN